MGWLTITVYSLAGLVAIPALPAITFFLIQFRRTYRVPSHLPWVGLQDKWLFPRTRASMREFSAKRGPIEEGHEKYSKHGQAFVLPAMHWPDVALPPSDNAWLISQPDSVLSTPKTQDDLLLLDHLGHGPDNAAVHDFSVITRDLTRQMGKLLPDVLDEVAATFEEELGLDEEEWKEVDLSHAIDAASRAAANRVFVGLPLCRDERISKRLYAAGITFSLCSAVIRTLVPSFLKPILAPLIGLPFFYQRWRLSRLLRPAITQRMHAVRNGDSERPNDALQWITTAAYNPSTDTFALQPQDIAAKTLLLATFAVFTTAITAGTTLLDILSHATKRPAADLLAQLRAEAAAILPSLPSNPLLVRNMHKLDSALRETLRVHPMFARGLQRQVVALSGVTTPSGLHLPRGTHVCAVVAPMQRDDGALMTDAAEYQPLRHCEAAEGGEGKKQVGAAQISPGFLSFAAGRHACPGRFFAVQTIKVMVGWLVLRYEFELGGEGKVEWLEVGEARLPPQGEKGRVRVRRRRHEGGEEMEAYSDFPTGGVKEM